MQKSKQYRQNAALCRRLAKPMSERDAEALLEMAVAWDALAEEAARLEKKSAAGQS